MNIEGQVIDYFRAKGELTLGDIMNKFPVLTPASVSYAVRSMAIRGVLRTAHISDGISIFALVDNSAPVSKPGKEEGAFMAKMKAMRKDAKACNARMVRDGRPRTPSQLAATDTMARKALLRRDADIARILTLMDSGAMSFSEIRNATGLSDSQVKDRTSFGVTHGVFVRIGAGNKCRYQAATQEALI